VTWTLQNSQSEGWGAWLLRDGYWNDAGRWIDAELWQEGPQLIWSGQSAQAEVWVTGYWDDLLKWEDDAVWQDNAAWGSNAPIWITAA
jgi:hypothetical protein